MSITIYSKPVPFHIKNRILEDNKKWILEDGCENYIKKELGCEDVE